MVRDSFDGQARGAAAVGEVAEVGARGRERAPLDGPIGALTGMALLAKWGITEREGQLALEAREVSENVLKGLAKVSPADLAEGFSTGAVEVLAAPGASIRLKPQQVARLAEAVDRTRTAASVVDKLSGAAQVVDQTARRDASFLDEVAHVVVPQIQAQVVVDDTLETTFEALLAYWSARYPGGPRGSKEKAEAVKEKAEVAAEKEPDVAGSPAK
jgi:hypothetical protein